MCKFYMHTHTCFKCVYVCVIVAISLLSSTGPFFARTVTE